MGMELFFENLLKIQEAYFTKVDFDKHGYKYVRAVIDEVKQDGFIYLGDDTASMIKHSVNDISNVNVEDYEKLPVGEAIVKFNNDFGVKWSQVCKAYYGHLGVAAEKADPTNVTAIQEGLTALVAGHKIDSKRIKNRDYTIEELSEYFDFNGSHKAVSPKEIDWNTVLKSETWIHSITECGSDKVVNACKSKTRAAAKNIKYIPVHEHLKPIGKYDFRFLYDDRHYGLKNKDMVQPADIFLIDPDHEKELFDALRNGKVPAVQYANGDENKLEKIFDRGGSFNDDIIRGQWENYYKWSDEEESKLAAKAAETGRKQSLLKSKKLGFFGVDNDEGKDNPIFRRRQSLIYNMNICTIMGWILPISLKKVESWEPHVKYSELALYNKDTGTANTNINIIYNPNNPATSTIDDIFIIKPTVSVSEKDGVKTLKASLACPFISVTPAGVERLQLSQKSNKYIYEGNVITGFRVKVSNSNQMEFETGDGGFGGKCGNASAELASLVLRYNEAAKVSKGSLIKVFNGNELSPEFLSLREEFEGQFLSCVTDLITSLEDGIKAGAKLRFLLSIFTAKSLKYKVFCEDGCSQEERKIASNVNDAVCNYFKVG